MNTAGVAYYSGGILHYREDVFLLLFLVSLLGVLSFLCAFLRITFFTLPSPLAFSILCVALALWCALFCDWSGCLSQVENQ